MPEGYNLQHRPTYLEDFNLQHCRTIPEDFNLKNYRSIPEDYNLQHCPTIPEDFNLQHHRTKPEKFDLQKHTCDTLTSHYTHLATPQSRNLQLYTIPLLHTAYLFSGSYLFLFKT
jgi:hypothetical protein